jgi:hypothetical protein
MGIGQRVKYRIINRKFGSGCGDEREKSGWFHCRGSRLHRCEDAERDESDGLRNPGNT